MIVKIDDELPLFSRYNGGWIKTVERLDKDYKNGYSLVGDFLPVSSGNIDLEEGVLYLDCSISGSRKNQDKSYTLFKLIDKSIFIVQEIDNAGPDWAMSLWESIEKELDIMDDPVDLLVKQVNRLEKDDFERFICKLKSENRLFNEMEMSFI